MNNIKKYMYDDSIIIYFNKSYAQSQQINTVCDFLDNKLYLFKIDKGTTWSWNISEKIIVNIVSTKDFVITEEDIIELKELLHKLKLPFAIKRK